MVHTRHSFIKEEEEEQAKVNGHVDVPVNFKEAINDGQGQHSRNIEKNQKQSLSINEEDPDRPKHANESVEKQNEVNLSNLSE